MQYVDLSINRITLFSITKCILLEDILVNVMDARIVICLQYFHI